MSRQRASPLCSAAINEIYATVQTATGETGGNGHGGPINGASDPHTTHA